MEIHLFNTAPTSSLFIGLTVLYFLCEAISTFDTRIIQAKKQNFLPSDSALIPEWTGMFSIIGWLVMIALLLLNWKFALLVFVINFVLKVLPVLENIGAFLLIPVVGRKTASLVNIVAKEQKKAAAALKAAKTQTSGE